MHLRMKLKTVLITTSLFLLVLVLIVFENVSYQIFDTLALTYIAFDDVFENLSYQIVEIWETWFYDSSKSCISGCPNICIELPDGTCAPCIQPSTCKLQ